MSMSMSESTFLRSREAMNIWMPPSTLDQECHLVATEPIKGRTIPQRPHALPTRVGPNSA